MKSKKSILLIAIAFIILMYSISTYAISFNLEINGENVVTINKSVQLKAQYWIGNDVYESDLPNGGIGEVSREDVTDKVSWISDNPDIAVVDSTGKVTGKSEGIARISVQYNDNTSSNHIIKVVASPEIPGTISPSTNESTIKAENSPKTKIGTMLIIMSALASIIILVGITDRYKNDV